MRFGSVCSGIEAASQAWLKLGMTCAFTAEIETFCCDVLAYHYADVPNLGDINAEDFIERAKECGPIDIIVGGPPCQAFSIAGLRGGLADPRGNLTLRYLAVVDALRPRFVVYENVPGILSATSHPAPDPHPPASLVGMECDGREMETEDEYGSIEDHAFSCFLAGLSELGYGFSYGSLDAQYFNLAQRRERVFVVGHLGTWQPAAAVLLDQHCMSGYPAPSREAGQRTSGTLSARTEGGGGLGTDFDLGGGWSLSPALTASGRGVERTGDSRGQDCVIPVDTFRMTAIGEYSDDDIASTMKQRDSKDATDLVVTHALRGAMPEMTDVASLRAASGGSSRSYVAGAAVRRLTPFETARLQGFPDAFTHIPRRPRKIAPDDAEHYLSHGVECWQDGDQWWTKCAADGPIYKSHGNSMAVPCMRHIGERLLSVAKGVVIYMTFTITSRHPGNTFSGQRILHNIKDNLPFQVEVSGPIPRTDYAVTCKCTEVYRISDESVTWLRKNEMLRELTVNPCVCLCCGVLGGEVVAEVRGYRSHYRKKY